ALQTIAVKTNTANPWLAWVSIANAILMLQIAKKPLWWIILFAIPIVNIVIVIMVWMGVAEARQKPNWWGVLAIIPLVNMVVPGDAAAVTARSVADGAARPAACDLRRHFVLRVAGVLFPAAAPAFAGLSLPARTSFAAASDISDLA